MRRLVGLVLCLVASTGSFEAQTKRPAPKPARPVLKQLTPETRCAATLGTGLKTKRIFCDVLIGRNPAEGLVIKIPPRRGPATLMFDLHNRHTYSEQETKAGRGFAQYTATVGVLTPDGTLLARAVVQREFRNAADLLDRVGGGAGAAGLKAVAPVGLEPIVLQIPQDVTEVSILGEHLAVVGIDGTATFVTPGRPIAVVSNIQVQYQEPPPTRRRRPR